MDAAAEPALDATPGGGKLLRVRLDPTALSVLLLLALLLLVLVLLVLVLLGLWVAFPMPTTRPTTRAVTARAIPTPRHSHLIQAFGGRFMAAARASRPGASRDGA